MSKSVVSEVVKYMSCPHGSKILDFYRGQFDSVYILLHPFARPLYPTIRRFKYVTTPNIGKKIITSEYEPISWGEVLALTDLHSFSDIDVALRTSIHGIREEFRNKKFSNILRKLTDTTNIVQPHEGDLSPFIVDKLLIAIQSLGHEKAWIGDNYGIEKPKLHSIETILSNDFIPLQGSILTEDYRLLVTTHWDSHSSFLCSSKETIDKILQHNSFEGFFCTKYTEVYWGLHKI